MDDEELPLERRVHCCILGWDGFNKPFVIFIHGLLLVFEFRERHGESFPLVIDMTSSLSSGSINSRCNNCKRIRRPSHQLKFRHSELLIVAKIFHSIRLLGPNHYSTSSTTSDADDYIE